jgi:hypothetical protein
MNTSQIENALGTIDNMVKHCFVGVFPCDKLSRLHIDKFLCAMVVNTDPSGQPGEHWVAFFVSSSSSIEYFDSFGMPPVNCDLFRFFQSFSITSFNDVRLQAIDSTVCGHYCIAFLARRVRGQSMSDIVSKFFIPEPGASDSLIGSLVSTVYLSNNVKNVKTDKKCSEQCCLPLCKCSRLCKCIESFKCKV